MRRRWCARAQVLRPAQALALTLALIGSLRAPAASCHTMQMTQILVSFADAGRIEVKIEVDLTLLLGSAEAYYALASETPARQTEDLERLVPMVVDALPLFAGGERLRLELRQFTVAQASKADFLDGSITKFSTFRFSGTLPKAGDALQLRVPIGANIDYPVAYTMQIPSARVSVTRWLEDGAHDSEPFEWAGRVPRAAVLGGAASAAATTAAPFDPDSLAWPRQLGLYLRLGFRHIVPEGTDHILFVLGLFFLGLTWRKLLAQTTVFTIAHATTLFLSTYGIFSLPSRYVEPGIAFSITWIAVENVVSAKLGLARLAIVFCFGLIHGLGFAGSLRDVPFPKRDFLVALLGFNFGVDAGQLFVIAMAFLSVGWFRNEPWFRGRIAIPCSLLIAVVGLLWGIQRIVFFIAR
jgi:hypothetical protein